MIRNIPLEKLSPLAEAWKLRGGLPKVELAAMEPTLWREEGHSFLKVVQLFADAGYQVNLTTNGSTLEKHAASLAKLPLDKIRISWHSLNPHIYEKMTNGKYNVFLRGIHICEEVGLSVCYNRVLFKNLTADIAQHIEIVDRQKCRIKFLELYVTEENYPFFNQYHMGIAEFSTLADSLPLLTREKIFTPEHAARSRYIWNTPRGGRVEFKIADTCTKPLICATCSFQKNCIEGFAEYFRVLPNGKAAFCYLRNDYDVPFFCEDKPDFFHAEQMLEKAGIDFDTWIRQRSLRLILTSHCNYNCSLPGGETIFCLGKRFRTM